MKKKSLIFVQINELNFDIVTQYVDKLKLKNFKFLLKAALIRTSSEPRYENLEPWIQWVSVNTGLSAHEHGVFRLGDITQSKIPQFLEQIEAKGFSVGAICPMNTSNRLYKPKYFIPDPWTKTKPDNSRMSKCLASALSQCVNDNANGKIFFSSLLILIWVLIRYSNLRHIGVYLNLVLRCFGAPWRKALFLDLLLHDIHMALFKKNQPNLSLIFLNAGAHIQHHYLRNIPFIKSKYKNPSWYISEEMDPFAEMLLIYDKIIGDYLKLDEVSTLFATGLTQVPYDKLEYYYRLKNHAVFLNAIGLKYETISPRMTRDFEVVFSTCQEAEQAELLLKNLHLLNEDQPVFGEVENRGLSLFVTLTFWNEITANSLLQGGKLGPIKLSKYVVFVAIKNGMHAPHGFACGVGDIAQYLPANGNHVKNLNQSIKKYFTI